MLNLGLRCLQGHEQVVRRILFHLQVLTEQFDLCVCLVCRVSRFLELPVEARDLLLICYLFLLIGLGNVVFFGLILFELFSYSLPVF